MGGEEEAKKSKLESHGQKYVRFTTSMPSDEGKPNRSHCAGPALVNGLNKYCSTKQQPYSSPTPEKQVLVLSGGTFAFSPRFYQAILRLIVER